MSPSVVLLSNPAGLIDPEFCMILQAIKAARRFCLRCTTQQKQWFLSIASKFQGTLKDVRGPATSLGYLLNLVDWKISKDGVLHVATFESFDITAVSQQRLARFLATAWQEDHFLMHTNRTSAFRCPDFDRVNTVAVLKQFSQADQLQLLREIAWGFQLESQKEKWCEDADGLCIFCGQADSRSHRLLHCPVGQDIRLNFPDLENAMEGTILADFPFITVHPLANWHRTLHFRQQWPSVSNELVGMIQDRIDNNIPLHWCTDGSCFSLTCHPVDSLLFQLYLTHA